MLQSLIALDESVFQTLHSWFRLAPTAWTWISFYSIYLVPVFLIWFWFAHRREHALFAAIVGAFSWLGLNKLVSHQFERLRPTDALGFDLPGKEGFFHRPGSSFPSDHAAFLVALTVAFYVQGDRRAGNLMLALTLVTVLARVVVGQHWPGDIIGGAVVGFVAVGICWLARRPIEQFIVSPLIKFARRLGL